MKRIRIAIVIILITTSRLQLSACDMCGVYMGIVPNDKKSFVAVFYRYRVFKGEYFKGDSYFPDHSLRLSQSQHGSGDLKISNYEIYRTTELRSRYFLHPKVELNVIMPYSENKEITGSLKEQTSGLGDLNLLAQWHIYEAIDGRAIKQRFLIGGGLKLPTGNYNAKQFDQRLPIFLQTGTGSTDLLLSGAYLVGYKKVGFYWNIIGKINGRNRFYEHFGNSLSSNSGLFYRIQATKNVEIMPSLLMSFEKNKGIYINKELQSNTGIQVLQFGGGFDVNFKRISLSFNMQVPVNEPKSLNAMQGTVRFVGGLTINFDQSKFLFTQRETKN